MTTRSESSLRRTDRYGLSGKITDETPGLIRLHAKNAINKLTATNVISDNRNSRSTIPTILIHTAWKPSDAIKTA
jgi:hypothetical protein